MKPAKLARWGLVAAALALAPSCRSSSNGRANVVIRLPAGPPVDVTRIRFVPAGHVVAVRLDEVRNLSVVTDGTAVTALVPETCPVAIEAGTGAVVNAEPLLRIDGAVAQVGFDAPVELTASLGCKEAASGRLEWRQSEGAPLAGVEVLDGGRRFRARTLPRAHFIGDPLPAGVVAVSPRTQGRYVVEATLSRDRLPAVRRSVTLTSIARATGLSSLSVSQRVLLGGSGWRVERAPPGSRARVEERRGDATFAPDVAGRFGLVDGAGNRLGLQALTHDRTPLDCGRAECHAAISPAVLDTKMTGALAQTLPSAPSPSCLFECHVAGQPGLEDGGFVAVMDELGFRAPGRPSFDALPRALKRLGGVRCTSCHGPGSIPERQDRARILRVAVCATCHDAPPAYTHVEDWRRSRMAHSDRVPTTRTGACARCHTTGGFLDAIGVRRRADASRDPDGEEVGVACAACHAAHGAHSGALVRDVEPPASLGDAARSRERTPGSVCLGCHSPSSDETWPSASSAVLVEGVLRLPAALGGGSEEGPSPHRLPRGCTGCHGASPGGSGVGHAFTVDRATCTACHSEGAPREQPDGAGRTLRTRATDLVQKLLRGCNEPAGAASHALAADASRCRLSPSRKRALYDAALVLEDPAAAIHNGPFARALLDRAEALAL